MRKGYLPSATSGHKKEPSPWTSDGWSFDPKSITNYSSFPSDTKRQARPGDLFLGQQITRRSSAKIIGRFGTSSFQTRDPLTILTALFVFIIFLSPGLIALTLALVGKK